jgi:hypothetical protein
MHEEIEKYQMDNMGILEEEQENWFNKLPLTYHCVFCGRHFERDKTKECKRCQEYKGIVPCVNNYCEWGER